MKKVIAVLCSLTLVLGICTGVDFTRIVKADNLVSLTPWNFYEGGEIGRVTDEWAERFFNSVTTTAGERKDSSFWYVGPHKQNVNGQEVTWKSTIVSDGFAANIRTTGWDGEYENGNLVRDNPYLLRAYMSDIPMTEGHKYTISFNITWNNSKNAPEKNITLGVNDAYTNSLVGEQIKVTAGSTKNVSYDFTLTSGTSVNVGIAMGSYLHSYNNKATTEDVAASGTLKITNFKITDKDQSYNPPKETTTNYQIPDYPQENINILNVAVKLWNSFSICTREDGGTWEDLLINSGQTKGLDYATEGSIYQEASSSRFDFAVKSTGWDGELDDDQNPIEDNPWGMTAAMTDIPVVKGKNYKISFQIKSTLKYGFGSDLQSIKHILFKAYNPKEQNAEFIKYANYEGMSEDGCIETNSGNANYQTVSGVINIPSDYDGDTVAVKFALGSMLKSYPKESAMSGHVYLNNFQIIPMEVRSISINAQPHKSKYNMGQVFDATGLKLNVLYTDGTTVIVDKGYEIQGFDSTKSGSNTVTVTYDGKTTTFNVDIGTICEHRYSKSIVKPTCTEDGCDLYTCDICGDFYKDEIVKATGHEYVDTIIAPTNTSQGYTLHSCKNCKYNYKDNYVAQLQTTVVEAATTQIVVIQRPTIKSVKNIKSKKAKISIKKVRGVNGYQLQYAKNKKFKSAKKVSLKKTTYTVKKLKKKKTYYFRVRAYKTLSEGKKYGDWSKVKKLKIKR